MSISTKIGSGARKVIRRFGYELIPVGAAVPREVRADYDQILGKMGVYRFKFLDVKTFIPGNLKRAYVLSLHDSPPLDVLDIGTGVGYFPFICEYYGHRAKAIDRDGNQVFEDATKWLGVDRRSWEIRPFEALPDLGTKFDLVTAFMVNFDRIAEGDDFRAWTRKEWTFFLNDVVVNHLKPRGRVALLLNQHTRESADVLAYFRESGARIDGSWVFFDSGGIVPHDGNSVGSSSASTPPSMT